MSSFLPWRPFRLDHVFNNWTAPVSIKHPSHYYSIPIDFSIAQHSKPAPDTPPLAGWPGLGELFFPTSESHVVDACLQTLDEITWWWDPVYSKPFDIKHKFVFVSL